MHRWFVSGVIAAGLVVAACGGGDGDDGSDAEPTGGDDPTPAATQEASPADGSGAAESDGEPGEVTISADPGQGVIDIDGETIVVTWDEARFKSCEIEERQVEIEFSLDDGRRLAIRGSNFTTTGEWGAIAYISAADSGSFQYELRFPDNATLGLSDSALSMEGGATYMDGFSPVDDDLRQTTIAVNCEGTEG